MKKRLTSINLAGTWHIDVQIELHAHSRAEAGAFLMELNEEIAKAAKHVANRDKIKVNLKKVTSVVRT